MRRTMILAVVLAGCSTPPAEPGAYVDIARAQGQPSRGDAAFDMDQGRCTAQMAPTVAVGNLQTVQVYPFTGFPQGGDTARIGYDACMLGAGWRYFSSRGEALAFMRSAGLPPLRP